MLFNSYEFIFAFAPLTFFCFFLLGIKRTTAATVWLTCASCFFYAWWEPRSLLLICASMLVNYACGYLLIYRQKSYTDRERRFLLSAGIIFNLCLLGFYKYSHFFANQWFWLTGSATHASAKVLPLGISFFTFVQIAFLVDAYRKERMAYNLLEYSFFVTYFPHLIAGPIIHHTDVIPELKKKSTFQLQLPNLSVGIFLFTIGLFKKTVLADHVAILVPQVFDASPDKPLYLFEAWGGALAYTLQIYYDFSGYSDMALGLSKILNITLPANFFSPYKAVSIVDFWRRWHISLSRFLRDYLYIPLGGNRKGKTRRYVNLMLTMILGGFWHGAGWTFILWGTLHGVYLVICHAWSAVGIRIPRLGARSLTFICVLFAWVFFRANDLAAAMRVVRGLFGINGISVSTNLWNRLPILQSWGVHTGGFFPSVPDFRGWGLVWLTGLTLIAWWAPNSIEILRAYKPASGVDDLLSETTRRLRWQWSPTAFWAIAGAAAFLIAFIHLNRGSVFLYFQF